MVRVDSYERCDVTVAMMMTMTMAVATVVLPVTMVANAYMALVVASVLVIAA